MLPRNHPDRIQITFDDRRLVANAGLLLPATLARHLGLPELVRQRLDLGDAPGRANTSDKMMTLVASALAGGNCIDDADVLRTGGTACTLGGTVRRHPRWAPSCAASGGATSVCTDFLRKWAVIPSRRRIPRVFWKLSLLAILSMMTRRVSGCKPESTEAMGPGVDTRADG